MTNTYTPPSTINYFNSNFTSSLIYYNYQVVANTLTNSTFATYSTITAFVPNSITVPVAGDYLVNWHTGAYSPTSQTRANYRLQFANASLVTTLNGGISSGVTTIVVLSTTGFATAGVVIIDSEEISYTGKTGTSLTGCTRGQNGTTAASHSNGANVTFVVQVGDVATNIHIFVASVAYNGSFFRKVSFPVAGAWILTPQWKPDSFGSIKMDALSAYYPWVVSMHGTSALDAINQQLTQFVDSGYKLMTNTDTNAWWGNLTNATVAGYGTGITNNSNAIISNTSGINSLTSLTNALSTQVSNLQNTVSGLTSISTISGGIRVKP